MKVISICVTTLVAGTLIACSTLPAEATTASDVAAAGFVGTPNGVSIFTEAKNGAAIDAVGVYYGLVPGQQYFTVVYPNDNCDPVIAFPVGPFRANAQGRATLGKRTANPNGVDLRNVSSVSVRNADANGNVIAVPGSPAIGLVQCNPNPTLTTG